MITTTIKGCARCHGTHKALTFEPFINRPERAGATHWAMCPKVKQPILLSFELVNRNPEEPHA